MEKHPCKYILKNEPDHSDELVTLWKTKKDTKWLLKVKSTQLSKRSAVRGGGDIGLALVH